MTGMVKKAKTGVGAGVGKYMRLNRVETSRLVMYLSQIQKRIEEEGLTSRLVAQMAREAMGLEMGDSTVKAVGKEMGIKWPSGWCTGRKILARLDQQALLVLTGAVTDLYITGGQKMPTALEDLKHRLTEELRAQFDTTREEGV
jgi:hypothetical protein